MPTNLTTRPTQSTKAHLNFGCHPGHLPPSLSLSRRVRPDAKGNIAEGRGSPNNERYTTSPNLILQQMAKCNLWPWQIAVLVKPSSAIRKKKWGKQTDEVGWKLKWRRQNNKDGKRQISNRGDGGWEVEWNKGEKDRHGDGARVGKKKKTWQVYRRSTMWTSPGRSGNERGKKKKKLRRDMSETMKGQLRAEPKWRRGGTRRDETAEQENNSKPYDNCERDPLITCHLWCRW